MRYAAAHGGGVDGGIGLDAAARRTAPTRARRCATSRPVRTAAAWTHAPRATYSAGAGHLDRPLRGGRRGAAGTRRSAHRRRRRRRGRRRSGRPRRASASSPSSRPHTTPSYAARGELRRLGVGAQAGERRRWRRAGSACARRRGTGGAPRRRRPARHSSASCSSSLAVAPEQARHRVGHLGRVQRARRAGGTGRWRRRSRPPRPSASLVGRADTANTVPDVPSEIATSPVRSPRPSAAAMLSPVPAATTASPYVPATRPVTSTVGRDRRDRASTSASRSAT